jgi:hypothetical protein
VKAIERSSVKLPVARGIHAALLSESGRCLTSAPRVSANLIFNILATSGKQTSELINPAKEHGIISPIQRFSGAGKS